MNMQDPKIGDKIFITYGVGMGEDTAEVTGRNEGRWGVDFDIVLSDGSKKSIKSYVGTARDLGDECYAPLNHGGIGAYLIV